MGGVESSAFPACLWKDIAARKILMQNWFGNTGQKALQVAKMLPLLFQRAQNQIS